MDKLSVEIVAAILHATTGGHSHDIDAKRLSALALVDRTFADASRRLLYRRVVLSSPDAGASFARSLRDNANLGPMVRSLTITETAYSSPSTFCDLTTDDLVRRCSQLVHYEPAVSSFAPLADGRTPAASYPRSLRHFRLARTLLELGFDLDDDDEESSDSGSAQEDGDSIPVPIQRLKDLPTNHMRSLKIDHLIDRSFERAEMPSAAFPLQSLKRLELVYTSISSTMLRWTTKDSMSAGSLTELKLWMIAGISSSDIKELLIKLGPTLKVFEYKSPQNDNGMLLNSVLTHLPVLERLSLGAGAANHHIYPLLPPSLKSLCVCLPNGHRAADLRGLVTALGSGGQLQSLKKLELYSQVYWPASCEIEYLEDYDPVRGQAPMPSLREVRLSHVNAKDWTPFFLLVGAGLKTLSVHYVNTGTRTLVGHCGNLRRLELGVDSHGTSSTANLLPVSPSLHLLRIHLDASVSLDNIVRAIQTKRYPRLNLLDVTGLFPDNVNPLQWTGAKMDELVDSCKKESVELAMNGRTIRTLGDLWGSVIAHIRS